MLRLAEGVVAEWEAEKIRRRTEERKAAKARRAEKRKAEREAATARLAEIAEALKAGDEEKARHLGIGHQIAFAVVYFVALASILLLLSLSWTIPAALLAASFAAPWVACIFVLVFTLLLAFWREWLFPVVLLVGLVWLFGD